MTVTTAHETHQVFLPLACSLPEGGPTFLLEPCRLLLNSHQLSLWVLTVAIGRALDGAQFFSQSGATRQEWKRQSPNCDIAGTTPAVSTMTISKGARSASTSVVVFALGLVFGCHPPRACFCSSTKAADQDPSLNT